MGGTGSEVRLHIGSEQVVHCLMLPGEDPAQGEDSASLVLLLEHPWPQVKC